MPTKQKQPGKAVKVKPNNTPKKEPWRKFTEKQVTDALKANMGLVMRAARQLGCGRDTVYRYIEEYPSCKEAKENGHEMLLDDAEIGLHKSIRDQEGWAICFTLKTLGKERGFVEKQITEVSGPNGGAIKHDINTLSDAELNARILELSASTGSGRALSGVKDKE